MTSFCSLDLFESSVLFLIEKTATSLPMDVAKALELAKQQEVASSNGDFALDVILDNVELAKYRKVPVCQDTGFPTFYVRHSVNFSRSEIELSIIKSLRLATEKGFLRPNGVDSLTGVNSGDNTGAGIPKIVFDLDEERDDFLEVQLILKGGGSENMSSQFALPCRTDFGAATRDLSGVKKVVMQAIKNAEGKGCAPGILGIHIGGDRAVGYEKSKLNFFRKLGDTNGNRVLADFEKELLVAGNELNVGPMGFGGKSTLLDVKVSASHRIPASFFVTIGYSCWALRRGGIVCDSRGGVLTHDWEDDFSAEKSLDLELKDSESICLDFPLKERDIRKLKVGDRVLLSGKVFTGRDAIHEKVVAGGEVLPKNLEGFGIYHCGPVMQKSADSWSVVAAGPTTSIREEIYQAGFIEKTGIRAILGKGGMGNKTLAGLKKSGAVYFHAIGGAAAFYAAKIPRVFGVDYLEELGVPEALWEFELKDFPVIVTMDSHGNSLH